MEIQFKSNSDFFDTLDRDDLKRMRATESKGDVVFALALLTLLSFDVVANAHQIPLATTTIFGLLASIFHPLPAATTSFNILLVQTALAGTALYLLLGSWISSLLRTQSFLVLRCLKPRSTWDQATTLNPYYSCTVFVLLWISSFFLFFLSVPSGTPGEAVARVVVGLFYSLSTAWFVTIILIIPDTRRLVFYGVLIAGFASLLVATLANTSLPIKFAPNREDFSLWQGYMLLLMPVVLGFAAWIPLLRERLVIVIVTAAGATQDAFMLYYQGTPKLAVASYLRIHPNIREQPIVLYKERFSPIYRQLDANDLIANPIAVNEHFIVAVSRSPASLGWMREKSFSLIPYPKIFEVRLSFSGASISLDNASVLNEDLVIGLKRTIDLFSQEQTITAHVYRAIDEEYKRLIPQDHLLLGELEEHMRLVKSDYHSVTTNLEIDFPAPYYDRKLKATLDFIASHSNKTNDLHERLNAFEEARKAFYKNFNYERFFGSLYSYAVDSSRSHNDSWKKTVEDIRSCIKLVQPTPEIKYTSDAKKTIDAFRQFRDDFIENAIEQRERSRETAALDINLLTAKDPNHLRAQRTIREDNHFPGIKAQSPTAQDNDVGPPTGEEPT